MEYSIRISLIITRNADVHVTGSNFRFLSSESLHDFPGVGMGSVFIRVVSRIHICLSGVGGILYLRRASTYPDL